MIPNSIQSAAAVVDYIEAHLTEKIDLAIVANAVHYSKHHLHRMFTHTFGLTIHEYVQRRRLTEAAKLLVFSNRSVLDLALIAGYESQQLLRVLSPPCISSLPENIGKMKSFIRCSQNSNSKKDTRCLARTKTRNGR